MATVEQETQAEHIRHSRDVTHGYSPAIGQLFDLVLTYVDDAEKAAREGKNVIWAGGAPWEIPLVYASDTIPVAYSEVGRISGKEAIAIAEDYFQMPPETCSMVKATIGEWYLRRNSPVKRIFGSSVACEPFNLAWEVMKKEGYDVYNIDVVYRAPGVDGKRYEELVKYFVAEIHDFAAWLTGSRKIDLDRLALELKRKNHLMAQIRKIMELRLKHPFYLRSLAVMYLLNGLNHYFGKPEAYTAVVDGLVRELESLPDTPLKSQKVIPLVWAGGNGQEFGIYDSIDAAGGALLGFVSTPFGT